MLSRLEDKRSTSMLYGFFCEVRATYVPASRAAKANSSRGHVETIKTNRQRRACSTHPYKGPKRRRPSFSLGLFPQTTLAKNGHSEPRQELCVLVVFGVNYALKLAARTQLEAGRVG